MHCGCDARARLQHGNGGAFFGSLGRLLGWFLNQQLGDSGGIIWILYVFWGIGVILMDFGEL